MPRNVFLIVEADFDFRANLREVLSAEGHPAEVVENGQAAIDYLLAPRSGELPSAIILDLSMPVKDGVTFVKTICSKYPEDLAKIPIIIATAKGSALDESDVPIAVTNLSIQ